MTASTPSTLHVHLVSDSTGETVTVLARAALAQFVGLTIVEHSWNLIRTDRQVDQVLEALRLLPGIVLQTLVDDRLRKRLHAGCREIGTTCIPVMDPTLNALAAHLGQSPKSQPGRQHVLNAEYFARIDAMDFAMANDDGHGVERLLDADVILVGVSRTSKTPTAIYLANRGIKVSNVPLIPGQPISERLNDIAALPKRPLIVGLTKDPESLVEIRRNRLRGIDETAAASYVDYDLVKSEVLAARRLFVAQGWPIIDVTRRSIEETAAEIMMLLSQIKERTKNASEVQSAQKPPAENQSQITGQEKSS